MPGPTYRPKRRKRARRRIQGTQMMQEKAFQRGKERAYKLPKKKLKYGKLASKLTAK